jgi:hypothetical protein
LRKEVEEQRETKKIPGEKKKKRKDNHSLLKLAKSETGK